MALGSGYQSNGNNQNVNSNGNNVDSTYYSRLRIKNPEENLALTFSFWKGTLKVSIAEVNNQDGKTNELAYIHLSPTKARILSDGVKRVISNEDSSDAFGVDTGTSDTRGFIAIGRNMGKPFLFIAKVNSNGGYESSQRFDFNADYNYLLKVHDISSLKCQKEYMNNIELQQFSDLLEDYARFASGAAGASFYDIGRYESARLSNMIRKIGGGSSSDNTDRSSNSYFNNVASSNNSGGNNTNKKSSTYRSIDDLESELG